MTSGSVSQRGFASLFVLWTLALLALLGSHLLTITRMDARIARNQLDAAVVEAAANGALRRAIFAMLETSNRRWDADGVWRIVAINGVQVAVRVDDESSKINPNLASVSLMAALLTGVGADPATAANASASIVEWRMATDVPGQPNAVVTRYRASGRAYAPSGAPFTHFDELGAVQGMTPELLTRLRPHLTLFTDADAVPPSRDPVVAQALAAVGEAAASGQASRPDTVSVSVDAAGSNHSRFSLRCAIRIDAEARDRKWRILSCERFPSSLL
jgi:general secretion pathway protein K